MTTVLSRLQRPRNPMPDFVARAKRPATREKRLRQMLDELVRGGVYMKMAHPASSKR